MAPEEPTGWNDPRRTLAVLSTAAAIDEAWEAFDAMVALDNRLRRLGVSLRERTQITGRVRRDIAVSVLRRRRRAHRGVALRPRRPPE